MRTRMTSVVGGFTPPSWRTPRTNRPAEPPGLRHGTMRLPHGSRQGSGRPLREGTPRRRQRAGSRGSARGGDVRVGLEVEHPVAPAASPVDDARAVRVRVVEEEEVVPDELHLVHGVLEGHGRSRVDLLADLDGRVAECTETLEVIDPVVA